MKTIKSEMSADIKQIELLPLADFHIGDAMADWKLIQSLLKHIEETSNCYCVLGGDLMDTAIASSIGDTYSANIQPMEQLATCVKLFAPIKDKILAVVGGNHENRIYKSDGIDTTQLMCNQLGIADRYSATTALLFVRFGKDEAHNHHGRKMMYSILLTHGSGGGRKEGGKINRLADLATIVDADVYITAHTHLPATFKTGFFRTSASNSSVQYVSKLFVNTAAALDYGGYGDKQGYKPSSKDYPTIILSGTEKKATVMF